MSEHAVAQPQRTNTPQEATKGPSLLQRRDMNQPEPTALQEWWLDTASGTFAEPRVGYDFSRVPAFTGMKRQNQPLLRTQPMVQRFPKKESSAPCPTCPEAESPELSINAGSMVEETEHAPEAAPTPTGAEPTTEEPAPEETTAPGLIVENTAETVRPGQMRRSEFLAQLRTEVTRAAEDALAGTGRTTAECPYLEYWFGYYSRQDSLHLERAIRRYAPETATATTARDYIPIIAERVRQSVETWARTGEITGIQSGLSMGILGMVLLGGIGGLISGIGNILFKVRNGGARAADDPRAVKAEMGEGQPLESGVRSRMESAFGMDFSHVRAHTDTTAARLSNRFNARAFTVGKDIAFGSGEYKPGTLIGDALIAHELSHVVQQSGAHDSVAPLQPGDTSYNMLENDADKSAVGVITSLWNRSKGTFAAIAQNTIPRLRSGLRLQSCSKSKGVGVFSESPRQKYAGYDDSVTPNGLVVPKDGTREVKLQKPDESVTIEPLHKAIASVEEKSGYIEVKGKKHAMTEIYALRGETIIDQLDVSVKRRKEPDITIHYYRISDNAGHRTRRPRGDEGNLTATLNEVWARQANVHFIGGMTLDKQVNKNLGKVIEYSLLDPTNWLAITNLATPDIPGKTFIHVFLVWEFERLPKHEGRDITGTQAYGKILLEDDATPLVIAHEAGHALGLEYHHAKGGIMAHATNSLTKRVFKRQADIVNP